jgi:nicotinamide mononucleotide (NMN) deamidase PncC
VCFAWVGEDFSAQTTTKHFNGSREEIRQQAANVMLAGLIYRLSLLK